MTQYLQQLAKLRHSDGTPMSGRLRNCLYNYYLYHHGEKSPAELTDKDILLMKNAGVKTLTEFRCLFPLPQILTEEEIGFFALYEKQMES